MNFLLWLFMYTPSLKECIMNSIIRVFNIDSFTWHKKKPNFSTSMSWYSVVPVTEATASVLKMPVILCFVEPYIYTGYKHLSVHFTKHKLEMFFFIDLKFSFRWWRGEEVNASIPLGWRFANSVKNARGVFHYLRFALLYKLQYMTAYRLNRTTA